MNSFLQRLGKYAKMPCANEWTELLGKIMAQILVILALSTKAMKERRISQSIHSQYFLLTDYVSEKIAKRLIGRTDVEDAFQRLESLTKDENLMVVATILEVEFDTNGNVKALQALVGSTYTRVQAMGENLEAIKEGTQCFLSDFVHIPTIFPHVSHDRYG